MLSKKTALKDLPGVPDYDKPFANMKAERDQAWVRIREEVLAIAGDAVLELSDAKLFASDKSAGWSWIRTSRM
jgi:hypothetical protein